MRRVIWANQAADDLDGIRVYISQFSSLAAQRITRRILEASDISIGMPERGRWISEGRRELAGVAPYLIQYRLAADTIFILEIRHDARRPES